MDKPKKDILGKNFCDLLLEECPTPELNCCDCLVFIKVFGK